MVIKSTCLSQFESDLLPDNGYFFEALWRVEVGHAEISLVLLGECFYLRVFFVGHPTRQFLLVLFVVALGPLDEVFDVDALCLTLRHVAELVPGVPFEPLDRVQKGWLGLGARAEDGLFVERVGGELLFDGRLDGTVLREHLHEAGECLEGGVQTIVGELSDALLLRF
ncbi:hypothetical protein PMAYCL1PPCAC_11037, partial [Pristionchus mayeri]